MIKPHISRFLFALVLTLIFVVSSYTMPIVVQGSSMNPTYQDGNRGFALYTNNYNRFDVVIIEAKGRYLVKRIIALPGETIEYKNNTLYINGEVVEDVVNIDMGDIPSYTLGQDEYYCLGDNRNKSADSRVYGPFKSEQVVARLLFATGMTLGSLIR